MHRRVTVRHAVTVARFPMAEALRYRSRAASSEPVKRRAERRQGRSEQEPCSRNIARAPIIPRLPRTAILQETRSLQRHSVRAFREQPSRGRLPPAGNSTRFVLAGVSFHAATTILAQGNRALPRAVSE